MCYHPHLAAWLCALQKLCQSKPQRMLWRTNTWQALVALFSLQMDHVLGFNLSCTSTLSMLAVLGLAQTCRNTLPLGNCWLNLHWLFASSLDCPQDISRWHATRARTIVPLMPLQPKGWQPHLEWLTFWANISFSCFEFTCSHNFLTFLDTWMAWLIPSADLVTFPIFCHLLIRSRLMFPRCCAKTA